MKRRRRPGTPYDVMQVRAYWRPIVARGLVVCRRCKVPIRPGQPWQLGHPVDAPYADGNRDQGLAPEHATCNMRGVWVDRPATFDFGLS